MLCVLCVLCAVCVCVAAAAEMVEMVVMVVVVVAAGISKSKHLRTGRQANTAALMHSHAHHPRCLVC